MFTWSALCTWLGRHTYGDSGWLLHEVASSPHSPVTQKGGPSLIYPECLKLCLNKQAAGLRGTRRSPTRLRARPADPREDRTGPDRTGRTGAHSRAPPRAPPAPAAAVADPPGPGSGPAPAPPRPRAAQGTPGPRPRHPGNRRRVARTTGGGGDAARRPLPGSAAPTPGPPAEPRAGPGAARQHLPPAGDRPDRLPAARGGARLPGLPSNGRPGPSDPARPPAPSLRPRELQAPGRRSAGTCCSEKVPAELEPGRTPGGRGGPRPRVESGACGLSARSAGEAT